MNCHFSPIYCSLLLFNTLSRTMAFISGAGCRMRGIGPSWPTNHFFFEEYTPPVGLLRMLPTALISFYLEPQNNYFVLTAVTTVFLVYSHKQEALVPTTTGGSLRYIITKVPSAIPRIRKGGRRQTTHHACIFSCCTTKHSYMMCVCVDPRKPHYILAPS